MKVNIRSKLVIAISLLIVTLFSAVAFLFINEKRVELADDIYVNILAYSKLSAGDVVEDYELFLEANSFVYFNREIKNLFEQNDDVSRIAVVSYLGENLYDSDLDVSKKYDGEERSVEKALLAQVQSEHISVRTLDGNVYFLKDGGFVDHNEKPISAMEKGTLIEFFVIPASEKYSVVYGVSYENLDARVAAMQRRIMYLALFGVMLGMVMSFFMSTQISKPVWKLVKGAENIAKGDFKTRVDIKTTDEIGYLGGAFNKMAVDLEASMDARLYKERVTRELQLATQIQEQLIPKEIPEIAGVDMAASVDPAGAIGGDMYDFLKINDNKVLMYLGDVTGHGVPAGIVSSIASALFFGFSDKIDLKEVMVKVNKVLKVKTMPNMFMTLCLMEWDSALKKFSFVSAGHEQLIHYKARDKKASLAPSGGMALGMIPDISKVVKVQNLDLESGDFVVCYSDGVPEAWKNKKEIYGMERLQAAVAKFAGIAKTAEELRAMIIKDVEKFTAGYEQMDDITIMVIRKS